MHALLPLNWLRVPSSEDNSVFVMTLFILSGVGPKPAPGNPYHVIQTLQRLAGLFPPVIVIKILTEIASRALASRG